jgi:hypothetical protein
MSESNDGAERDEASYLAERELEKELNWDNHVCFDIIDYLRWK